MKKGTIELLSRYGDITKLIPLNHYVYKVDFTENPYSYRCIYAEDNKTIEAFDPSGGPYVSVGTEIVPNIYVKSIYIDKKDLLISVEIKKSNY